jgi:hypothetical protein
MDTRGSEFGDDQLYEIIDGARVDLNRTLGSTLLANKLTHEIARLARPLELGWAVSEMLFELPLADRARSRRPGAAFVSHNRWPKDRPFSRTAEAWAVIPDLAVDFFTPKETGRETFDRLRDYLDSGVRDVWLVFPWTRSVLAFESRTLVRRYTDDDEVIAGEYLAGFRISANSLSQV